MLHSGGRGIQRLLKNKFPRPIQDDFIFQGKQMGVENGGLHFPNRQADVLAALLNRLARPGNRLLQIFPFADRIVVLMLRNGGQHGMILKTGPMAIPSEMGMT